jgi:hypothetical protein
LKTSFKSNFFFCFPGGGGAAVVVRVSSKSLSLLQHIKKEIYSTYKYTHGKLIFHSICRALFCYDIWRRAKTWHVARKKILYVSHTSIQYILDLMG